TLLSILADWDAFRHAAAVALARGAKANAWLAGHRLAEPLSRLAALRREPDFALCADLWLNAQRRATGGRFDDAVARLYRLTEAAVQAQLWRRYGVPNPPRWSDVPEDLRRGLNPSPFGYGSARYD